MFVGSARAAGQPLLVLDDETDDFRDADGRHRQIVGAQAQGSSCLEGLRDPLSPVRRRLDPAALGEPQHGHDPRHGGRRHPEPRSRRSRPLLRPVLGEHAAHADQIRLGRDAVDDLLEALARNRTEVQRRGSRTIIVSDPGHDDDLETELLFFLKAWALSHPTLEIELDRL